MRVTLRWEDGELVPWGLGNDPTGSEAECADCRGLLREIDPTICAGGITMTVRPVDLPRLANKLNEAGHTLVILPE